MPFSGGDTISGASVGSGSVAAIGAGVAPVAQISRNCGPSGVPYTAGSGPSAVKTDRPPAS